MLGDFEHDVFDAARIFAFDHFEDVVDEGFDSQVGAVVVGLAPAVEALIRFDLDERPMPVSVVGHKGLDGGDFHIDSFLF